MFHKMNRAQKNAATIGLVLALLLGIWAWNNSVNAPNPAGDIIVIAGNITDKAQAQTGTPTPTATPAGNKSTVTPTPTPTPMPSTAPTVPNKPIIQDGVDVSYSPAIIYLDNYVAGETRTFPIVIKNGSGERIDFDITVSQLAVLYRNDVWRDLPDYTLPLYVKLSATHVSLLPNDYETIICAFKADYFVSEKREFWINLTTSNGNLINLRLVTRVRITPNSAF